MTLHCTKYWSLCITQYVNRVLLSVSFTTICSLTTDLSCGLRLLRLLLLCGCCVAVKRLNWACSSVLWHVFYLSNLSVCLQLLVDFDFGRTEMICQKKKKIVRFLYRHKLKLSNQLKYFRTEAWPKFVFRPTEVFQIIFE